jgi:uncharacterized protein (TIGR02231 family)
VNVGTDGQAVTLKLGDSVLPSQLYARTQPQQSAQAYLVADVDRPAGSWPRGQMQMFRDGRFVGQSAWSLGERSTLSLGFGIDEQVRVQVAPEQRNAGSAGFIGSRSERSLSHVYTVQNLHKRAVTLQLIEPTPVAQHEDLKVTRRLDPAPTQSNWQDMPGVALWQLPLAAGQSVTLRADYQLSAPKDAVVDGWR